MFDDLATARERAQMLRFSGDVPYRQIDSVAPSRDSIDRHYQSALEISEALTPSLWTRIGVVCDRLRLPRSAVAAFIYSSPEVQAECLTKDISRCVLRFSSGLVDLLTEEEFEFVVGHEIGHFLLDHRGVSVGRFSPEAFIRQRSSEISADRIGFAACGSLETSLRAIMKTVSGLTEKHLRFDVSAFISQLRKIEDASSDWSGSSHPSMVIRAKALLWLSLTDFFMIDDVFRAPDQMAVLDQRVDRDLHRFVDGAVRRRISDTKDDIFLWMMALEIFRLGSFSRSAQIEMRENFDDFTVERLIQFMSGFNRADLEKEIQKKITDASDQLDLLMPYSSVSELAILRSRVEEKLAAIGRVG